MLQVGPHICVFKTHVDIFDRWDESIAEKLRQTAEKHGKGLPVCSQSSVQLMMLKPTAAFIKFSCGQVLGQSCWMALLHLD